ncbi:MAG TPA: Clp protease N-terminal domain-containing protein [Planctomycetota bacterium]|nr:Clp protease N-terminal domain-containing protein [Planctomycetota bacterium]
MIPLTDRARDVIEIARREAADLRHDHLGTEHVLLGILREGGGIASRLTQILQLKVNVVRKAVEMLNKSAPNSWTSQNQLPYSPRLRSALKSAETTAQSLGHPGVGISHLFLGLTEDEQGKASLLLINLGLDLKETRREMLEALSRPSN